MSMSGAASVEHGWYLQSHEPRVRTDYVSLSVTAWTVLANYTVGPEVVWGGAIIKYIPSSKGTRGGVRGRGGRIAVRKPLDGLDSRGSSALLN